MEARAIQRYTRLSPQKARLVVDLIRGKSVETALGVLDYLPKRGARLVAKTLRSAVANAESSAGRASKTATNLRNERLRPDAKRRKAMPTTASSAARRNKPAIMIRSEAPNVYVQPPAPMSTLVERPPRYHT